MPALWERIEIWLQQNAKHLIPALNPPVSQAAIDELEQAIDAKLPTDFVEFLRIHNGQKYDSEGLMNTEELLSAERILDEWKVWKKLLDDGIFEYPSSPDKGVKSDWWNPKWIPITYDGHGNHLCLDLDPANGGRYGQIIHMWHDSAERECIAFSFKEWINTYVTDLEKGNYIYSEGWAGLIHKDDL
ncbi:MAG: SMI1/KNR4 family protein [Bacteroidota bacterium]